MRRWFSLVFGTVIALSAAADAQVRTQQFFNPTIRDFRLDFCRNWGAQCGQPAADLFCLEKGFERAVFWQPSGPAGTRTLVFGDGRLCSGPQCSSFSVIHCASGQPQPPPPQPTIAAPAPPAATPTVAVPVMPATQPPLSVARPIRPEFLAPLPRLRPERGGGVITAPASPVTAAAPAFTGLFTIPGFSAERVSLNWFRDLELVRDYPQGASLFKCAVADCGVANAADLEVDPRASDQSVRFNWSVQRVPHAGAALWQVGYFPFPAFGNGSADDLDPRGLVFSGRSNGDKGFFAVDFRDLSGRLPPGAGAAIFHVRILPVSAIGLGRVVGRPSNVMRVYYGADPPQPPPLQFYTPEIVAEAPPVRLVGVEFRPHKSIDWPRGCVEWEDYRASQQKNFFEKVAGAFTGMWNFAAEAYQWAKDRVVDIAGRLTFGVIPDQVLSFALDSALASVGIPPDIPNLDELMSGGLDHLAAEMAGVAVSQIPAADLSASLGSLGADVVVNVALAEGEARARQLLRDELEKTSRQALVATIDEMQSRVARDGEKVPCSRRLVPASYRIIVENAGLARLRDVAVGISDSEDIYEPTSEQVSLRPGQRLSFVLVPDPNIRDVWDRRLVRTEPMATTQNWSNWWNELLLKKVSRITITLPGHTECLGSCVKTSIEAHGSAPQRMDAAYQWAL